MANDVFSTQKPAQSKGKMLLISFFLGAFGIHRKMMGYKNWWLQLILFPTGFSALWAFSDFIEILRDKMKMADGRDLV